MPLLTIKKPSQAVIEEKKSRFIAHLVPFAEFDTRLGALRHEHPKAAHYVTAFRAFKDRAQISENAKDDGEPSGTSGMPVLKTLIGADLIDVGIIVVRYFGGTKLGTGGLARAYSSAAKAAIDAACLQPWQRIIRHSINANFEKSSALEKQIASRGLLVINRLFTEKGATLVIEGPEEEIAALGVGTMME